MTADVLIANNYAECPPALIKILFLILQHSNTPSTLRLTSRIVKLQKDLPLESGLAQPIKWFSYSIQDKVI